MPFYPSRPRSPHRIASRLSRNVGAGLLLLLVTAAGTLAAQDAAPELDIENVFAQHGVVMLLIEPVSGAIVRANPAAAEFYGYSREELERLSIDAINTFDPEQVADERERAQQAERNFFIFRHRLASGDTRKVEVASRTYTVAGRALLLSIIRDATPASAEPGDLLHYQEQLERQVDSQVARVERIHRAVVIGLALSIAVLLGIISYLIHVVRMRHRAEAEARQHARDLSRAHEELQRFAEIAAHHLMEPSRRLVSYSGKLRRDLPDDGHNEAVDFDLEAIERAARRQRDLVADIQRYLAAGEPQGEPNWLKTEQELLPVLAGLQARLEESGGQIERGPLPSLFMDRGRFRQLLEVLVANAIEHQRPGIPPRIRISGEADDDWTRLRVEDNGPGIEPGQRERALRIFERLRHDGGGTGIGLPIARRIVESLGGNIVVDESSAGGARITIELPIPE